MSHRRRECLELVADLARTAGATCAIERTNSSHYAATLGLNGHTRKIFLSSTPSSRAARVQVKSATRRVLRELGAAS